MIEIIAELGINHNGNMHNIKKMIDIAFGAGCQYVKFQKRDVELVYSQEELNSSRQSPWGSTFREQKLGLELGDDDYAMITDHCGRKPIKWFASAWDTKSMDYLLKHPACEFVKIPSALITNQVLCTMTRTSPKKVMLSTGMSTLAQIDDAIEWVGMDKIHSILSCTSTYPSKPQEQNLRCIQTLKNRYPWAKIGFSNHSPGIVFMAAAVALGAELIEYHLTLDRSSYGSDQASSVEPEGAYKIEKYIRAIEQGLGDGTKRIYESEIPIMKKLRR